MSDFTIRLEHDQRDPGIVTKMHCTFESCMGANRIQAFLEDLQRQSQQEYHVETVIEKMRRRASCQLYVRIGFREMNVGDDDEEWCRGK
ncbi:hypothetical protein HYZ98_02085 [Candidatus Peregrinibacteria bacterium]|nr:hypothetical protein [Candidatus Peregrinibacteria bacterium]